MKKVSTTEAFCTLSLVLLFTVTANAEPLRQEKGSLMR